MDAHDLNEVLERRDGLTQRHPALIGRHAFYHERRPLVVEGLWMVAAGASEHRKRLAEICTVLLQSRAQEKASHLQRIRTAAGDEIHEAEYELYSLAFDVFQSAVGS